MIYEWDPEKARINLRAHRIAFEEAATVFLDPLAMTYPDGSVGQVVEKYDATSGQLFHSLTVTRTFLEARCGKARPSGDL